MGQKSGENGQALKDETKEKFPHSRSLTPVPAGREKAGREKAGREKADRQEVNREEAGRQEVSREEACRVPG